MTPVLKTCSRCGAQKPATTEFFYPRERGRLQSQCKECRLAQGKAAARATRAVMDSLEVGVRRGAALARHPDYMTLNARRKATEAGS